LLPSLVAVPPVGYEVPRARYVASGTVWHYTTGLGLIGIVENSELWASSFAALNDLEELSCGSCQAVMPLLGARSGVKMVVRPSGQAVSPLIC